MARIKTRLNLFIAAGLILVNLFTWGRILLAASNPHVVDPVMDPEVRALLDYIHSGEHSGETWEVSLTELEAEQTITWYLNRYPQIPFAYPEIHMTPDSISGEGDVIITGLHFHVSGEGTYYTEGWFAGCGYPGLEPAVASLHEGCNRARDPGSIETCGVASRAIHIRRMG